jgi:hypothetical protein
MATVKSINAPKSALGDAREKYDLLANKLSQLAALLRMTHGNAGETFNEMNDELREKYLWACGDMARDCEELADLVGTRLYHLEGAEVSHG